MSDSRMAGQRDRSSARDDVAALLAGYRPLPGIFDEMVDRHGRVRAHWQPLLATLAALGGAEIGRRFAAADPHATIIRTKPERMAESKFVFWSCQGRDLPVGWGVVAEHLDAPVS